MEPWHRTTDWELAKQPCSLPNPEKNWNCPQFQQKSCNNQENTGLLDMTEVTVCHPNTRYAECEKRFGEHSLMEMPCGSVKDPSLSLGLQRILGQFKPREKSKNSVCVSEKKKRWNDPRNVRNRRKQHKYLIWIYAHKSWITGLRFKIKSLGWIVLISPLPTCTLHPAAIPERQSSSFGIIKLIFKISGNKLRSLLG